MVQEVCKNQKQKCSSIIRKISSKWDERVAHFFLIISLFFENKQNFCESFDSTTSLFEHVWIPKWHTSFFIFPFLWNSGKFLWKYLWHKAAQTFSLCLRRKNKGATPNFSIILDFLENYWDFQTNQNGKTQFM